jgi:HEAT repeat protein
MQNRRGRKRWLVITASLVLMVGASAVVVGLRWSNLASWYAVRGLTRSTAAERAQWIVRIGAMNPAPIPQLVAELRSNDADICDSVSSALAALIVSWHDEDDRCTELAEATSKAFPQMSVEGQRVAIEIHSRLLDRMTSPKFLSVLAELLNHAASTDSADVRSRALELTDRARQKDRQSVELLQSIRLLVRAGLGDKQIENRIRAIRFARDPEIDLAAEVVQALSDPAPEVRRSAMLIAGPLESAIPTDDLVHWLHDSDQEVRRVCEKALRARGLQDESLLLGRVITDAQAGNRLQIFSLLKNADDVEPGVWLRRLSHDSSPAVRAAAIRAAAEQTQVNLADRIQQMAQNDPCPTVRQLAEFYLSVHR